MKVAPAKVRKTRLAERNPFYFKVRHGGQPLPYLDSINYALVRRCAGSAVKALQGRYRHEGPVYRNGDQQVRYSSTGRQRATTFLHDGAHRAKTIW